MNIYEIEFEDDIILNNHINSSNLNNVFLNSIEYNDQYIDDSNSSDSNSSDSNSSDSNSSDSNSSDSNSSDSNTINYLKYKMNNNPLKLTMKKLNIPMHKKIYLEYILTNPKILNRNNNFKFTNICSYIYKFKNYKFIMYEHKICNIIDAVFHKNKKDYLHIMIDNLFFIKIYIICIKYYKNTFKIKPNKLLIDLAINYITKYIKNKSNINICILDNHNSYYLNM